MYGNTTEIKDYYAILGVAEDASGDEIRKAYRLLAREWHPDRNKAPEAEDRFKAIAEAYDALKDPAKRAAYDQLRQGYGQGVFQGAPSWDGTGFRFDYGADADGLSDLFENLFGTRPGPGATVRRPSPARGGDLQAEIEIALETAYRGGSHRIQIDGRSLDVKVPAGITSGQRIRLGGQGVAGRSGGHKGDLILTIRIRPHARYDLDGKDLGLRLPIAPWEAALGAKVKVPTLSGEVELSVPPKSRSGQKLRLKGRGLPGSPAGDMLVVLEIVTPPADDEDMRRLYDEMRSSGFDPRRDWH